MLANLARGSKWDPRLYLGTFVGMPKVPGEATVIAEQGVTASILGMRATLSVT